MYSDLCTLWGVRAWILAWEQLMEHQSIGCRRRWRYIGECMHWKHGVNTWTSMQAMVKVYTHMGTTIVNKNNDNTVCNCMCTCWGVCASILAWNNWWNISRSVVVDDAHYVGDCTHWKHGVNTRTCMQWIQEQACTETMGTINVTSVDQLSNTMLRYWYLQGLKTWSEYMNMHAVNTCKQSRN